MEQKSGEISKASNYLVKVSGLVQGVGFRPFLYREATALDIKGKVENRNDGVYIHLLTSPETLQLFVENIRQKAPQAASIENIVIENASPEEFLDFSIHSSQTYSDAITEVSPDIAVCDDCLDDMKASALRTNYPFVNCTNCGPRFTIIRNLPYDRAQTTMDNFQMCPVCSQEYHEVTNRRFHAQPTACNHCGPSYSMIVNDTVVDNIETILATIATLLRKGEVIGMKGLGGFHLMCDAFQESAVLRLRDIKSRESKPFAVMCRDLEAIRSIAHLNPAEEESLASWRRPIVLLQSKNTLAPGISNGLEQVGVMLPYLPFHHLLFEKVSTSCIVLTSGNISDEPIVIDNEHATTLFHPLVPAVILNNRDIHNRCDDSVVMIANNHETLIRRSRGYVPAPVKVNIHAEGIFGAGAELTNCFAMGKGSQVILSQHIGDLKNVETYNFYKETIERFSQLFRFTPAAVACDIHPNYLSSVFATELSEKLGIPLIKVQHHHAHIASCMAEHHLDEDIIGISLDGVGLGTDGNIWGGEIFTANLGTFQRRYHFEYIPISGGNEVAYEPWRSALSYLEHYFGDNAGDVSFIKKLKPDQYRNYKIMLRKKINTWQYSSAGRLFDAVAAITGVCIRSGFHAEAPMRLESVADKTCNDYYGYRIIENQISFRQTFDELVADIRHKIPVNIISAKFHHTVVQVMIDCVKRIREGNGLSKVVLSGGTFQNRWILERIIPGLKAAGMEVYTPYQIPANDGGIALGQIIIAAKTINVAV